MKTLGEMQRQQRGVAKDRFMVITGKAGLVLHRTGCHCGCSATKSCTTLWPHGLQHSRLPYPSPSPGACSHSCPLSGWCHPTILSSVAHFSSCPRSFLASGSFPVSQLFAWRRQWHPTPVLWAGKSHGRRSLEGCSPQGHKESDTAERLSTEVY